MKETLKSNHPERIPLMYAFSGTTRENFLTCSNVLNEQVYYSKNKELRHTVSATFFATPDLEGACHWAILRALELGHQPLIMKAKLTDQRAYLISANQIVSHQEKILIETVYVLKENSVLTDLQQTMWDNFADQRVPDPANYFEAHDPYVLLTSSEQ